MRQEIKKLSLNEQIDVAKNQLVRARISLDIWWHYIGSPTRDEVLESMNEFLEFFRFDEHAHRTAFIIQIATLFDKRKGAVTLENLKNAMLKIYA